VLVPETLPFARLLLIQEIWHAYKHLDRRLGETSNTSARFHAGSSLGRTGGQGLDLGLLADAYDASRHPDVVQGGQAANAVYRCVVGALYYGRRNDASPLYKPAHLEIALKK
jgi:hypothetical protein